MKLLVTHDHAGEGDFPIFPKGTMVEDIKPAEESLHWMACTINHLKTYVPDVYLTNGRLSTDYNPTELVLTQGEVVILEKVVFEWFSVKRADGVSGWVPASKVVSVL